MRVLLLFLTLAIVGAGLFAYSCTLTYYKNQARFDAAYQLMKDRIYRNDADHPLPNDEYAKLTDEFYALQKREMTLRWPLKDTGLTLLLIGLGGAILFCRGIRGLKTPPNKWLLLPVGLMAAIATFIGMALSLKVDASPIWADTEYRAMGIMMITSMWFFPLFVLAHGLFLVGHKFSLQTPIFGFHLKHANWFFILALGLWAVMTIFIILGTAWFYLIATPLWFYFYASLLAIRAKGH